MCKPGFSEEGRVLNRVRSWQTIIPLPGAAKSLFRNVSLMLRLRLKPSSLVLLSCRIDVQDLLMIERSLARECLALSAGRLMRPSK